MSDDAELQEFRASVNCAAVLETMAAGWRLDEHESTRRALKYRRGEGEILIINHDGRGWWDPLSRAKGDVFDLVQHLDPSLNFGHVRRVLRRMVGVAPSYPAAIRARKDRVVSQPVSERWKQRPRLRHGSRAWRYLTEQRALRASVVNRAADQDSIRQGSYGNAWFAHYTDGQVCHVEIRGLDYRGALTGGTKTLFRFAGAGRHQQRLVIAEAPIDALSVADLEQCRGATLYAATGGGIGPGTVAALQAIIADLAAIPDALVVSAADANAAGDRYAEYHAELAGTAGVRFERLRPPDGLDWNDVLQKGRGL
jgi:hypothetical protein